MITNNDNILAQISINNKIADHESIDIFIYNESISNKKISEVCIFKYTGMSQIPIRMVLIPNMQFRSIFF